MGIRKSAIAISWILLLTATGNHAVAADVGWSKELRDTFSSRCNQNLLGQGELSKEERKTLRLTCECLTDGYSKTVPDEVVAVLNDLSPEELEKMPEYEPAKDVAPSCYQKHGLQGVLDARKAKPIPQEWREDFLMGCVFEKGDDAKNLKNGGDKLAKACRCFADRFLPTVRGYANEKELTEAGEAMFVQCKGMHLTD